MGHFHGLERPPLRRRRWAPEGDQTQLPRLAFLLEGDVEGKEAAAEHRFFIDWALFGQS
jgi:hypothetical protein